MMKFSDAPLSIRLAAVLSFFQTWVLFENHVVDRTRLHEYMPLYRVGDPCIWDLAVGLLLFGVLIWSDKNPRLTQEIQ
jgi:hypothetical protein